MEEQKMATHIGMKKSHTSTPRSLRETEFKWAPGAEPYTQEQTPRWVEYALAAVAVSIALALSFGKFVGGV